MQMKKKYTRLTGSIFYYDSHQMIMNVTLISYSFSMCIYFTLTNIIEVVKNKLLYLFF